MFTGIIQAIGSIANIEVNDCSHVLSIATPGNYLSGVKPGDSICVNGVCLTVTSFDSNIFKTDVSAETIRCTSFKQLEKNSKVNLEQALTLSDHLGGHLVTGHVDGVGLIKHVEKETNSTCFTVTVPKDIAKYIARKGSICMDGVSLTVNSVDGDDFTVNIIPHTLENTVIIGYRKDTIINLEIDLIARYVERLHTYN
ncbi:MAG: riboflavin synthase [Gammaproteobacteria bacterium]